MPKAMACRAWSSTASATRWWCRSPPRAWRMHCSVAARGAGQAACARKPSSCATTRRRARWKAWNLCARRRKGAAGRIAVEENGARYFADLGQGQKTGWYYDQRDNRAFMAGARQAAKRARRLLLHRRLRHSGRQGRREGSRLPGFLRAGAGAGGRKRGGEPGVASAPSRPMCSRRWSGWRRRKKRSTS